MPERQYAPELPPGDYGQLSSGVIIQSNADIPVDFSNRGYQDALQIETDTYRVGKRDQVAEERKIREINATGAQYPALNFVEGGEFGAVRQDLPAGRGPTAGTTGTKDAQDNITIEANY